MGILGRIHSLLKDKANAVLDAAQDPAARVETLIRECHEHSKAATAELLGYKASEKRLAQKADELAAQLKSWHERAEAAVRAGDDELARKALLEEQRVRAEHAAVEKERRELSAYAAQLLEARRGLARRLQELELRRGTVAQNLSGSNKLAASGDAWDRFANAESRIDDAAALAEVDALLGDPLAEGDQIVEAKLRESMKRAAADDALAELKKKMGTPGT